MAKKKQNESEDQEQSGSLASNGAKVVDPSHMEPMEETGPPARPKAIDPSHSKPQE